LLGYNRTRKAKLWAKKTIPSERAETPMNLPSDRQAQEKNWLPPADIPTLEQHQQDTDFRSSIAIPNDRSILAKPTVQSAPWKLFLVLGAVSVGLHLLALRIPIPAIQPVSKVNQPINAIRLAVAPKPKRLPEQSMPKLTLPPTSAKPKAIESSSRLQNRSVSRTAIAPTRKFIAPSRPKPTVPVAQAGLSPAPELRQDPKPDPAFAFKDFPTYPGSILSPESPASTTTAEFKKVADYFDEALLVARKRKWNAEEIVNEPGKIKSYRVSSGGVTKILSVFSKGQLGTAYVLTDRLTTLEALEEAEAAIASISDALGSLKALEKVDVSRIAQPKLFQRNDSEIVSMNLIEAAPPEKVFTDYLSDSLAQQGFDVPKPSAYGGGPVYVLNRGQFTGYLNLVPSQDGTGTVIVFWKVPPA
jgi:hypothetical protein